ncbi:guanine nucleotide-binding protein subunit gamma-1-like [Haematobia irritans]|uniref:guanine nucleotide-binding protein subunit gamma-1-like n=1 Tax=Haematobia irritans TaxID=7368 RepID=UPI003F4F8577
MMAANVQQQRVINEQLRREAEIPRIRISETCMIMMKYMADHENEDYLLKGFSSPKLNPFKEKPSCTVL